MHRLPTVPFDRSMPEPDELEEPSDPSILPDRIKLGAAWVGATVVGIVALVYSTVAQFPRLYTMAGLVGVLLMYAVYGLVLRRKNPVQFADSLYYMGFLWALFALIVTFMIWPVPKLTPDAVLTTFGYALVATFSGLLLRLLVIQFQPTLSDRVVYAQETIDGRVAALSQQLHDATMEITSFRERAASELAGTLQELLRALGDVRATLAEQQRALTLSVNERVEASVQETLGRLAAIEVPHEQLSAEVARLTSALRKRGGDVEQAVQQLEKGLAAAAHTVTQAGDSLYGSEAARRIGQAVEELSGTLHERTRQLATMTAVLESSRTELEGQLTSLPSLRSAFAQVSTHLATLEAELKDVSVHALGDELKNGLLNVQQAIESSLDASKAIEAAMRGVRSFLKDRVAEEAAIHGK